MTPESQGNLKSNVRFKSSVNQRDIMKRATPMRKFVGAEFGRLLFRTLPCMRNGKLGYRRYKHFQDEEAEPSYQMAGKEITPKLLLEAIRALPEERRKNCTAVLL